LDEDSLGLTVAKPPLTSMSPFSKAKAKAVWDATNVASAKVTTPVFFIMHL
jgi:hypothetical protein